MRFSGTVSLISGSYLSWAVVYVGSVYVFGFWFFWGLSLVGYPRVSLSPHLLSSVVQVWAGCVGAGSSVCTRF